jgi:hypothetical protein
VKHLAPDALAWWEDGVAGQHSDLTIAHLHAAHARHQRQHASQRHQPEGLVTVTAAAVTAAAVTTTASRQLCAGERGCIKALTEKYEAATLCVHRAASCCKGAHSLTQRGVGCELAAVALWIAT